MGCATKLHNSPKHHLAKAHGCTGLALEYGHLFPAPAPLPSGTLHSSPALPLITACYPLQIHQQVNLMSGLIHVHPLFLYDPLRPFKKRRKLACSCLVWLRPPAGRARVCVIGSAREVGWGCLLTGLDQARGSTERQETPHHGDLATLVTGLYQVRCPQGENPSDQTVQSWELQARCSPQDLGQPTWGGTNASYCCPIQR